jgi:hypothetical protein
LQHNILIIQKPCEGNEKAFLKPSQGYFKGEPMKQSRIISILRIILILTTTSFSQNFAKVIEIVGNLEDSMTVRFAKEEQIRSSEIISIRTDLEAIKTMLMSGDQSAAASESKSIVERIALLEQQSNDTSITNNAKRSSELLHQLIGELQRIIDDEKQAQQKQAVTKAPAPSPIQFSGVLFSNFVYSTEGKEGKDFNRFDLERIYVTAKGQIFDDGKIQITTDMFRGSSYRQPDSIAKLYYGGYTVRMKFAFMDYTPLSFLSVKLGLIPTVWPSLVDGVWKYRGISATVSDLQSYFPTADMGVSVSYALPGKMGDLSGFILNGSGFTSMETNRYKDFALRASVYPFVDDPLLKPLLVAGYVYKGSNMSTTSTALPRNRFGGLISYSYSVASATVEFNSRQDAPKYADTLVYGTALSFFGEIKAPVTEWKDKFSFVWRYDLVEPDDAKGGDMTRLKIVGITYKPVDKIILAIDRQWTDAEAKTMKQFDNVKISYDNRWFFHAIINF